MRWVVVGGLGVLLLVSGCIVVGGIRSKRVEWQVPVKETRVNAPESGDADVGSDPVQGE